MTVDDTFDVHSSCVKGRSYELFLRMFASCLGGCNEDDQLWKQLKGRSVYVWSVLVAVAMLRLPWQCMGCYDDVTQQGVFEVDAEKDHGFELPWPATSGLSVSRAVSYHGHTRGGQ